MQPVYQQRLEEYMRVTNTMISNSAKSHIANAKNKLLKYEEQYTSQQKIQRPSDDPVVAVRSLKLRTTYAQITQYAEKNVRDAMEWMDMTEGALTKAADVLELMKPLLAQGNCDSMEVEERNSVKQTLKKYVDSIFEGEANQDYSGRYLFTGYRTDTSLLFPSVTNSLEYKITEEFNYASLRAVTSVIGGASYSADIEAGQDYVDTQATTTTAYRLQLAYKNCAMEAGENFETGIADTEDAVIGDEAIAIKFTNSSGEALDIGGDIRVAASTESNTVREVEDGEILYLYDTGEILVGSEVFNAIQENQASISVDYLKTEFNKFDVRPEMYFKSTCHDTVTDKTINYSLPENQTINYEINFSQTIDVNTQARDAFSTDIYRTIEYIEQTIQYVDETDTKIEEVKKLIQNTTDEIQLATLNSLKSTLEDEKQLRVSVMAEAFGIGLTMIDTSYDKLNIALADMGARYKRTELTYDKLLDNRLDTEDKLSENEGVDLPDVFINITQSRNLYDASLSATSKILGNTLLDYI